MSVADLLRTLQVFDPLSIFPSIDTPYSKYSTSNYTAPSMDIPPMRDIMTQCREQLDVIDTVLEQIKSTVQKLSDKREQIASSMKMHEGFMSCIRRLPSDVLSHIFMQCLPDATYPTPDIRDAPLLLTQICRGWRGIALDTPRLWCSLSIADIRRDSERLLTFYQHWLANSGRCPLSLEIRLTGRFDREQCQWSTMVTEFSRVYTSRCTTLRIYPHSADGLDLLLADVPNLERLYFRGPVAISQNISIVQPRPRLHTLVIISSPFAAETLSFFNPGWTNLTCLAVSFHGVQQPVSNNVFLTLLQTCPNLENFVFSPVFIQSPDNPITLTHSKLRTLSIERRTGSIRSPLDTLIFPNLRRLVVGSGLDVNNVLRVISTPEKSLPDGRRTVNMTFNALRSHTSIFTFFNPGWTGLIHVRLDVVHGTQYCLIPLQFCPQLEGMALSIRFITGFITGNHRYTPSPHHTLCSLTLGVKEGSIDTLLDALTLPSLHHLNLAMTSDWPDMSFKDFFSRSHCPLDTLGIRGRKVSNLGREEFTSLIPTLRQLDLRDTSERLVVDVSA